MQNHASIKLNCLTSQGQSILISVVIFFPMSPVQASLLDIYTMPLRGHTLIEASAGTGKTWTISGLYTRLLLDEALNLKVSEILVVTFTRAATAELRDRIRKRLSDVLMSFKRSEGIDDFCSRLLEVFTGNPEWAINKLTRAVASFDEAAIYTIDGFCQRLLGEAAFETGSDFRFELLTDERLLLKEVTEDFWRLHTHEANGLWMEYLMIRKASPESWLNSIRPFTGKLIQHWPLPDEPATQETETQLQLLMHRFIQDWKQENTVLKETLLTSNMRKNTLKALLERWAKIDEYIASNIFPEVILKAALVQKTRDTFIYFTAEKLSKSMNKEAEPLYHPLFESIEQLLQLSDQLIQAYNIRFSHLRAQLLHWIEKETVKRKNLRQQMSFHDLLFQVWKALHSEQQEAFKTFTRTRYRAALIDEFQDTDPMQCTIFESLFATQDTPLYYVGDPKQSIYGFRGADIHAYLAAKNQVAGQAIKTLGTNQRSIPSLIHGLNALFGNQQSRVPFMDPGIQFYPVQAADRKHSHINFAEDDGTPLRFLMLPPYPEDPQKSWKKETAIEHATDGTANEIAKLLTLASKGLAQIDGRPLHGGDIAILVQDSWKAKKIQEALIKRGIPSVRQARESVYDSSEAKQFLSVLTAIVQSNRGDFVRSALTTELMGYPLPRLLELLEEHDTWDTLLNTFAGWHALWRDHGFTRMFRSWLDHPGQDGFTVPERLLRYPDGERRLTNILHLSELIQIASRHSLGLESILTWFAHQIYDSELSEEDNPALVRLESDAQRVKIVTIHASKGLEYPIIFCPYLFDSKFRDSEEAVMFHRAHEAWLDLGSKEMDQHRLLAAQSAMEENLRLLYVALTRAKHRCYIVWGNVNVLGELKEAAKLSDLLKTGFHTSPLTWLLHPCPSQENTLQPIEEMRAWCTQYQQPEKVKADIEKLMQHANTHQKAIGYYPLISETIYAPAYTLETHALQPAAFHRPPLQWGWQVASFSGLTRHVKTVARLTAVQEAPDRDEEAPIVEVIEEAEPLPTIFNFPLGEIKANVAGTCVHGILENWDWDQPDTLADIVRQEREKAGLSERWTSVLTELAENTVYTPITEEGICLAEVSQQKRLPEMEFTFPVSSLSVSSIIQLLNEPAHQFPLSFQQAAYSLSFHHLQGYLRGFIDLCFEAGGKFYVLDYKTNWLGSSVEHYHFQAMEEAMAHHHYYLQYLLYTIAVHRYLKERLSTYNYPQHFGGIIYLFQRGLDRSGKTGVYRNCPDWKLIQALEKII